MRTREIGSHPLILFGVFFFSLALIRIPLAAMVLPYRDDGETLYHAFALLRGLVPYREDISHHFLGYVLPFCGAAKIFGMTPSLIPLLYLVNQALSATLLYAILRFFLSRPLSLTGACLLLCAREPFVLSFFPFYEVNLLMLVVWYCALRALRSGEERWLFLCALAAGAALTFDQRGVFLAIIPVALLFLESRKLLVAANIVGALASYLAAPILALIYLATNNALVPFFEQTLIYPFLYRSAGTPLGTLRNLIEMHLPLLNDTPILLLAATSGAVAILARPIIDRSEQVLLLFFALPVFLMPLLGGRGFDYYSLPYLPLLALLTPFASVLFSRRSALAQRTLLVILWTPVLLAAAMTIKLSRSGELATQQRDAVSSVVEFLKNQTDRVPNQTFLWGYRPDLYVLLKETSPLPFVNRQLIHPDAAITGQAERESHVYPKYADLFRDQLHRLAPQYIVLYEEQPLLYSPSDVELRGFVGLYYEQVFAAHGNGINGSLHRFSVFKRRSLP